MNSYVISTMHFYTCFNIIFTYIILFMIRLLINYLILVRLKIIKTNNIPT